MRCRKTSCSGYRNFFTSLFGQPNKFVENKGLPDLPDQLTKRSRRSTLFREPTPDPYLNSNVKLATLGYTSAAKKQL